MRPDPAEIVRTLAAGHRPAVVHTANLSDVVAVPSAVDEDGTPLLLIADHGVLGDALGEPTGLDTALSLAAGFWVVAIVAGAAWHRHLGTGPVERLYRHLGG